MRLWSLHPKYLDRQGLVALWRETLLARAVLRGQTRGYRHHPQLDRFRQARAPISALNAYLRVVYEEARARGYHFDRSKLAPVRKPSVIPVTKGQLEFEWTHLLAKLRRRSPEGYRHCRSIARVESHPLFRVEAGARADWERVSTR